MEEAVFDEEPSNAWNQPEPQSGGASWSVALQFCQKETYAFHIANASFWEAALLPIAVVVVIAFSSCMDILIGQFVSVSMWYAANFYAMGHALNSLHPQPNSDSGAWSPFASGATCPLFAWCSAFTAAEIISAHMAGSAQAGYAVGTTLFGLCGGLWLHTVVAPWRLLPPECLGLRPHKVRRYVAEHRLLELQNFSLQGLPIALSATERRSPVDGDHVQHTVRTRAASTRDSRGENPSTFAGHLAFLTAGYSLLVAWWCAWRGDVVVLAAAVAAEAVQVSAWLPPEAQIQLQEGIAPPTRRGRARPPIGILNSSIRSIPHKKRIQPRGVRSRRDSASRQRRSSGTHSIESKRTPMPETVLPSIAPILKHTSVVAEIIDVVSTVRPHSSTAPMSISTVWVAQTSANQSLQESTLDPAQVSMAHGVDPPQVAISHNATPMDTERSDPPERLQMQQDEEVSNGSSTLAASSSDSRAEVRRLPAVKKALHDTHRRLRAAWTEVLLRHPQHAWGEVLVLGAMASVALYIVDYGKRFEFSMPYLIVYNIMCLRVPDLLGHSIIATLGDIHLYASVKTATTCISLTYMCAMQAYLAMLRWVCQNMTAPHLFPRFYFVAQMYYYLFWYMMLMVISPGGVEDWSFWVMVTMLSGTHLVSNTGLLQQMNMVLRHWQFVADPPLKTLFDSKLAVQDQLADVVSLLIVPSVATSFHICASLHEATFPSSALLSLWLRFGALLLARLLSGLLTEEFHRRRVDLLNKADAMDLRFLPLDESHSNRTRYLNDMCIGPKLAMEALRNIERCELYFTAIAVSCTFAVFQRGDVPTRYAFVAFGA